MLKEIGQSDGAAQNFEGESMMYSTIATKNLSREQWLYLRKSGIGGSDAGAICGLNPYVSPMAVYQDKVSDEISLSDNEAMRQGRDLEEYVAQRFTEVTGMKVRRSNKMYRSTEHPWMIADIDRMIVGSEAGLECKTVSAYNADKWADGAIPMHYLAQCYHYMIVTGHRIWYLAAVILGQDFQYRKIEYDEAFARNLIALESDFWNNHVKPRQMPDPDGSKSCDEVLDQSFKIAKAGASIPLVGFDEKLRHREELRVLIQKLEQEQKQIDQEIKVYMKDCEQAISDRYKVSWSQVETVRLDTKRIKAELPDIYENFSTVTQSRRFMVKAA